MTARTTRALAVLVPLAIYAVYFQKVSDLIAAIARSLLP